MWCGIITLFPTMFQALDSGITGRAQREKHLTLQCWNPRDFAKDNHGTVDNPPYGGGPGLVMMAEPLNAAIEAAKKEAPLPPTVVYLSPQGKLFDQDLAKNSVTRNLILIAGRYEGIDERIIRTTVDEEWSIGNYVLSGGELAAMVVIDAIARFIPGAVGNEQSIHTDSLSRGLLKYPQYTRPEQALGLPVPQVLLSGNHKNIEQWRLKMSLGQTWLKRPDLLEKITLSTEESCLLTEFIEEWKVNKL